MANELTSDVRRATTWSIAISVLMIAAGVLAIALPSSAGIAVTALVGWLLVFSGVLHLAFAWRGGGAGAGVWEILLGLAYGVVGFYVLADPVAGLASPAFAFAGFLFVRGGLGFGGSLSLRPAPRAGG